VQAEAAMAPVVDLLGAKADIQVRFIASVSGDDINEVKSLHGAVEGIEDARQLCVAKNYSQETLWDYIGRINKDCYPVYRNGDDIYKTCWQKAAKDAGVSTGKLDACVAGEGVALIQKEDAAAKSNGVSGSPTLIINGVKYNGGRTPESYKQAICAGFATPPAECSETLSTDGASADGGC
jgi:predicted DsbA family dithiol-disulfide isomerase